MNKTVAISAIPIGMPGCPEFAFCTLSIDKKRIQFDKLNKLLEFSINPESPYIKNEKFDLNKEIVLFCAAGGRSALAAKTLKDIGFEKVSHIAGGFNLMKSSGFKIK